MMQEQEPQSNLNCSKKMRTKIDSAVEWPATEGWWQIFRNKTLSQQTEGRYKNERRFSEKITHAKWDDKRYHNQLTVYGNSGKGCASN